MQLRAGPSPRVWRGDLFWNWYPLKENGVRVALVTMEAHGERSEGLCKGQDTRPSPARGLSVAGLLTNTQTLGGGGLVKWTHLTARKSSPLFLHFFSLAGSCGDLTVFDFFLDYQRMSLPQRESIFFQVHKTRQGIGCSSYWKVEITCQLEFNRFSLWLVGSVNGQLLLWISLRWTERKLGNAKFRVRTAWFIECSTGSSKVHNEMVCILFFAEWCVCMW